jgi:hypothetical protein
MPGLPTAGEIGREVMAFCAAQGFVPAALKDFERVHAMAAQLMSHKVSSVRTFKAVQAVQPWSSYVFREDGAITGLMGLLLLRRTALSQLLGGSFNGVEVDTDLLSRDCEIPAIGYGWGFAATTPASSAALKACGSPLRFGPLGCLTFVSTAVTPAGRHVCMTRYGYRPMRHPDDNLLISDPIAARKAA